MGDVNADNVGSGPVARATVRVMCSVRCTGRIGLWLELGCSCDVRLRARLSLRLMIRWR